MEKWLQFTQFRKISAFYLIITGLGTSLTHRLAVGVGGEGGGGPEGFRGSRGFQRGTERGISRL